MTTGQRTENNETRIYRLAVRERGVLTVSDVVVQLGITAQEAETLLDRMTDGVRVHMGVDDSGVVCYTFPEIRRKSLPRSEVRHDG